MSMLHISISEAAERRLKLGAQCKGVSVDQYASDVLERMGTFESLDEMMAPVRKQFEESGMTDAEFKASITDIREDIFLEKQLKAG